MQLQNYLFFFDYPRAPPIRAEREHTFPTTHSEKPLAATEPRETDRKNKGGKRGWIVGLEPTTFSATN